MQILLSGLSEQACLARLGADTAVPARLCWHSADDFIAAAEAASPKEDERLWVWFYRAPWEFLAQAGQREVATTLAQWQAEQRAVLGLRRVLGQKLLLVNIDRVAPALLCARLELPWPQDLVLPEPSGLTPAIAGLFERMAPQYWDLYEMLEAIAWLPEGEPQFRHDLPASNLDGLLPLLQTLQDGLMLPALRTALTQTEQQRQHLEQALKESRQLSDRSEAERQSLADKNQQLQTQLQQVQENLQKQQAEAASADKNHAAALKQQEQQLAESGKQLQQASDKLKKLEQELEKNKQAAAQVEGERQSLAEENDLLLAQLHQVQEELEQYYLDGKAQAAVLAESGKQLQQTTDKLKKLEQELEKAKQATAKLDGEHQAQVGKNQLLQTMLQQVQGELAQGNKELEKARQATAKTEAERQALAGKSQQLQAQLQQVQEDVKKQQAQAASADKNHAAALKQQEQKLAESGKQLQQASDKLKKLEQEQEKNRQAATQAEGERQSLAEENDLLLAQLHQVQEELESYYLANRELQAVMGQSQQTLHRARAVVSRLVCNA